MNFYSTKQWERLFRLAERLKLSSDLEVKTEAFRYQGLGYYKLRKYADAIICFSELTTLVNYKTDWFNLAMSYAQSDDVENSEIAFQKIYSAQTIPGYKQQVTVPMMLQLYASTLVKYDQWEIALKRISEIKQMYIAANTGNEDKLVSAGLPPLKQFFQLASLILTKNGKDTGLWFAEIKRLAPVFEHMH